ncbi:ribonucleotide reductase large subunit [Bovine gammaherpesvirus 4]|uniref:Ribonucleoside-diphosphate reductase large subunit n=2 Tax=Bovine herpesvirus 4 TaxID=10385 RepID=A0A858PWL0_BHV4|nr:ribonucleotide reductase large subunit [Bovine gammaherpesvirus 4]AAK07980.1 ribonucleotide reductase large subunit [Bovine gammaherpesvirus 4]QJC19083.1 ribonucleotide reductase large subunit [Bovine gammaherpesvirus 4]
MDSFLVDSAQQNSKMVIDQDLEVIEKCVDNLKISAGWNIEDNMIAGRLYHKLMDHVVTTSMKSYLDFFKSKLSPDVGSFMENNAEELDSMCLRYQMSSTYNDILNCGILAAKRFYDTYLLRTPGPNPIFESIPHFYTRISVFCAVQCLRFSYLKTTIQATIKKNNNREASTDMDIVHYFFGFIASQVVCCATPVLRSAGVESENLASCFIVSPEMYSETSTITSLYSRLFPLLSSKSGVGMDITSFANDQKNIHSCLKLINAHVEFFNDHNIRPVSVATYIELWHVQIFEFLYAKVPENSDRCASIFQAVCVPSLFFKLYEKDPMGSWHLFDPSDVPGLKLLYGKEFEDEYHKLVQSQLFVKEVPLKSIMFSLINTIIKTGSPYVILKEAINQHHWCETQGEAINAANLCAEIVQHSGRHVATCSLANICLPKCLEGLDFLTQCHGGTPVKKTFSFQLLTRAVEAAVFVINAAIVGGHCVLDEVKRGQGERAMGIGVQGLADVFAELGYGYLDKESEILDRHIFECMYYSAVKTSHDIVRIGGGVPFEGFDRSKLKRGLFHWQEWEIEDPMLISQDMWLNLGKSISQFGIFNSQFIALMPTAGTSQITGHSEAFYPFFANMSSKVSNKEEIMKPNITFLKSVRKRDLDTVRFYNGDVSRFPEPLAKRYQIFLNAFDYCPFEQMKRARQRAPFVDQSQSFSLFLKEENVKSASYLKNLLLYGYNLGLKTIMYYCRIQKEFTVSDFQCLDTGCQFDEDPDNQNKCEETHNKSQEPNYKTEAPCQLDSSPQCDCCQ